jgi:hypothetical protein
MLAATGLALHSCRHPPTTARDGPLQSDAPESSLARLSDALRAAHATRRGVPAELQDFVRAHARDFRLAGGDIGTLLVAVKLVVRETTGVEEPIFTPKVVGWTIAGFFDGTAVGGSE